MNQLTRSDGSSVDYLWEPIFDALGYDGFQHTGGNFPTATHLGEAAAGRRVFLIIDEIERWFMPQQKDDPQAQANLTFLQNLTEFCQDASNGVIAVITLLRLSAAIQQIVDRADAFKEDLTQAPDRRQIVLHRLVESVDRDAARPVVDAYIEQYKPVDSHVSIGDYARYREDMLTCYPFHPAVIETVFDRYSSVASYQNSRGALYLLAHVLREAVEPSGQGTATLAGADPIRVGDISLTNRIIYDDLASLDTQLVNIARHNAQTSGSVEHADAVLSTVLDVNKADRLSQVSVDLEQAAKGQSVAKKLGQILGLRDTQVGDATRLEVRCYLREAAVTNRDQLVQLLDGLPKSGDTQVTVRFTKESPKGQGDQP